MAQFFRLPNVRVLMGKADGPDELKMLRQLLQKLLERFVANVALC